MTCIIGYTDGKKSFIIGDKLGSSSYHKADVLNPKVFKIGDILFGYTTSFRFGQIIQFYFKQPEKNKLETDLEYMIKKVVPHIREILEEHKYSKNDNEGTAGNMIIIYNHKIFMIQDDWAILDYKNYMSVGSGRDIALGVMYGLFEGYKNLSNTTIEKYLIKAIKGASKYTPTVSDKYDIIKL